MHTTRYKTEMKSALIAAAVAMLVAAPLSDAAHSGVRTVVKVVKGKRGPVGPTGAAGPQGPAGQGLTNVSLRATSNRVRVDGFEVAVATAVCPTGTVATDGGFVVEGDARITYFGRLSDHAQDVDRQGYEIVVRGTATAENGRGIAQVRAYCAKP